MLQTLVGSKTWLNNIGWLQTLVRSLHLNWHIPGTSQVAYSPYKDLNDPFAPRLMTIPT